jgi:hypothetical protein
MAKVPDCALSALGENTLWGVRRGLALACVYSAYVIVVASMQRSIWLDGYGATVYELLLIYFAGGVIGGAVIGVLRPLNSNAAGGALIGALASVPFWVGTLIPVAGMPTRWDKGDWIVLFILVGLGALVGLHFATKDRRKSS